MKKVLLLLALAGMGGAARADVSWEHRGSIKLGGTPLAYFSMKNEWSGQKHRTSVLFDATKFAGEMSLGMPDAPKARGEVRVVERLDDDRLILSSPELKKHIDEPYKSLKSRLRINFWEALGSDLPATDIPELTPAQRARMGQEIRAVLNPFVKKMTRTYFRPIVERKTISGLEARGYRLTTLSKVDPTQDLWVRTSAEWWVADELGTDEEIRTFTQSVDKIMKDGGGPTASMWINEYMPIMWEAMSPENHQAIATLIGKPDSPKYGFVGTPLRMYVTVALPPAMGMGLGGDIRMLVDLSKRSTAPVDQTLFDVPTGSERVEIEPFLGMARNAMKMAKTEMEKALEF